MATINIKCNETFSRVTPEKLKDFARKRQIEHTSTVMEHPTPLHAPVKFVDAEDITNEKNAYSSSITRKK